MALIVDREADSDASARLRRSWERNAAAWTDAVRERRIESRNAGTDASIVEAVRRVHAHNVLDVGCGEGWLARALSEHGCRVVGIDASAPLIDSARGLGGGSFEVMAYESLADRAAALGAPFDVVACNFALLEEDLAPALRTFARTLAAHGRLIVQTVHPWIACGDAQYVDGWRVETFAGFGAGFAEPMPWYFRTLQSWIGLLDRAAALGAPFDVVACNFALLEEDLAPALRTFARTLAAHGRLIVQTVHPWVACGAAPYVDGWRVETFAGFGAGFAEPMPWYFRTLQSWIGLLDRAGFRIERIEEPLDGASGRPLSLLMTATRIGETA